MPWDLGSDRLRAIVEPLPSGHDYEPRGAAHSELCGSTRGRPLSLLIARKPPSRYRPTSDIGVYVAKVCRGSGADLAERRGTSAYLARVTGPVR